MVFNVSMLPLSTTETDRGIEPQIPETGAGGSDHRRDDDADLAAGRNGKTSGEGERLH